MADDFYNTGTVSVAAGGTTVTATGALWSGVLPGDTIEIGDLPARTIAVPTDATHLELAVPVGIDLDDVPYTIRFNAPIRFASYTIAARQREVLDRIGILESARPNYEVQSLGSNTPPVSPVAQDMYVVGTSPTGAWAGQANRLAQWTGLGWLFTPPEIAASVVSVATGVVSIWNGTSWLAYVAPSTYFQTLMPGANAAAVLTALGFSIFIQGLRDDADGAAARVTLGAQAALGFTPLNKAGDTMPGTLNMQAPIIAMDTSLVSGANTWSLKSGVSALLQPETDRMYFADGHGIMFLTQRVSSGGSRTAIFDCSQSAPTLVYGNTAVWSVTNEPSKISIFYGSGAYQIRNRLAGAARLEGLFFKTGDFI